MLAPAELLELEGLLWERERRGLQRPNFGAWQDVHRPGFDWDSPHFRYIQDRLDSVTAGGVLRLLIQVSIRHGKTESLVGYMAYRLELDPTTRILLGTYGEQQSHKLSRAVRRLLDERGVPRSKHVTSAGEWETAEGGGIRAVGAGTGVASVNADLIVIDDPIGSRAKAESVAHREMVWDWITTDLLARAEPHTQVIFSMPRWHADDPAGRMQDRQAGSWEVIDMPGIAEEDDQLGREPGELLWPSHRPQSWIDSRLVDMGSYGFASAVQCRPSPRDGGVFKWEWWQLIDDIPASGPMVRYWDLAGTDKRKRSHNPDWTAGALLCRMPDKRTAIVDVTRFQKSVASRDAELERICREDLHDFGGRVVWWFETEAGINGKARTETLLRRLQATGMTVRTEPATGSKTHRAEPLEAAAEAGNVVLCPGEWRDPFRTEASDFPNGLNDDQIDGAAGALSKLNAARRSFTQGRVHA
jgi:predicted phage terminase large subunit-like protein